MAGNQIWKGTLGALVITGASDRVEVLSQGAKSFRYGEVHMEQGAREARAINPQTVIETGKEGRSQ